MMLLFYFQTPPQVQSRHTECDPPNGHIFKNITLESHWVQKMELFRGYKRRLTALGVVINGKKLIFAVKVTKKKVLLNEKKDIPILLLFLLFLFLFLFMVLYVLLTVIWYR